jgi:hypothetical protein
MQKKARRKFRRREVFTGMLILAVAFSFFASLVLDFNFVSPYATLQEDLSYLSEHTDNQKISAWLWMGSAAMIALTIPFYLFTFHKRLRWLQYLNALFMAAASASFFIMSVKGLELHDTLTQMLAEGFDQADEATKLLLLDMYSEEQYYRYIGSSMIGLFAIGLGLTRIVIPRFPMFATILLLLSAPVLVFFNWYDRGHVARTAAMAGVMIGVVIFSVRLINKGLSPRIPPDQSGEGSEDPAGKS